MFRTKLERTTFRPTSMWCTRSRMTQLERLRADNEMFSSPRHSGTKNLFRIRARAYASYHRLGRKFFVARTCFYQRKVIGKQLFIS